MKTLKCRACDAPLSKTLVDLGLSPLANSYLSAEGVNKGSLVFPLHAYYCENCYLVQLEQFETPEHIFSDYKYFSSFSTEWLAHSKAFADQMISRFQLGSNSKVVEIASNDGYLLQYFIARGIPVLGVEPAENVAKVASSRGIPTEVAFFGCNTARSLRAADHSADLMVANNVLAHVPNIIDFAAGFSQLLKPNGIATFEFPHVLKMLGELQFDTIYHEHFSYLSLHVVRLVLERVGMRVFDVEKIETHGGSLRVYACLRDARHEQMPQVEKVVKEEIAAGLLAPAAYAKFHSGVVDIKADILEFLVQTRRENRRVVGYGAAAKGNTFLNYCGVGREFMSVVADRSPHKQGFYLPGTLIPIVSPEEMMALKPDYVLILPWNFKHEIASQLDGIREWGGKFVTAIPHLTIF